MYIDDVTEGVQDEEESEDDDSVKTDGGDNVMSLYSRDEKIRGGSAELPSIWTSSDPDKVATHWITRDLAYSNGAKRGLLEEGHQLVLLKDFVCKEDRVEPSSKQLYKKK
ncbi:hypothetical protein LWI28_013693 [Acer negundo]|uniref:Uncharacterized protein n=1 Tax=Acer negundo TaxID=4023 RepID=A0AAD5IJA1_ACENE|nr:hypothetical protein LWI28_013693 [Acer negundo]